MQDPHAHGRGTGRRWTGTLCLCESYAATQASAYRLVAKIDWPNVYYRDDIGYRAVSRNSDK